MRNGYLIKILYRPQTWRNYGNISYGCLESALYNIENNNNKNRTIKKYYYFLGVIDLVLRKYHKL